MRFGYAVLLVFIVACPIASRHSHLAEILMEFATENIVAFAIVVLCVAGALILEFALLARVLRGVNPESKPAPDRDSGGPRGSFKFAAAVLAIALAFIVSEGMFRWLNINADPPLEQHLDTLKVDNRLNAMGIREDWNALDDGDPRLRIAFLGDSFTYGESVEMTDTFCHILETMLGQSEADNVVTINMGKPGTGPIEQRERFAALQDRLDPDIVVHVVYMNDIAGELQPLVADVYNLRDGQLWVGNWSRVLEYVERQIRYRLAWRKTVSYFRGGQTKRLQNTNQAQLFEQLLHIKLDVEQHGATHVIVLFPWLCQLDDYLLTDTHQAMAKFASDHEIPFLDLLPTFEGLDARMVRISAVNEHPNPNGHRLAAVSIARFLKPHVANAKRGKKMESNRPAKTDAGGGG